MQTKSTLRQYFRDIRRQISQEKKLMASQSIVKNFFDISTMSCPKKIAVYLAHDGELDVQLLIQQLWQKNYSVFLPIVDTQTQLLRFAHYTEKTSMQKNSYGIEEPQSELFIMPQNLDIVLVPLVAFDNSGTRLGMGKGYYDKSFAFRDDSRKPLLIGVAYACQQCDRLPRQEWDVPLDAVLTEKEFLFLGEAA